MMRKILPYFLLVFFIILIAGCGGVPKEAKEHFLQGNDYFLKTDFLNAASEYQKAVGIYPKYQIAKIKLAEALIKIGRTSEAKTIYNEFNGKKSESDEEANELNILKSDLDQAEIMALLEQSNPLFKQPSSLKLAEQLLIVKDKADSLNIEKYESNIKINEFAKNLTLKSKEVANDILKGLIKTSDDESQLNAAKKVIEDYVIKLYPGYEAAQDRLASINNRLAEIEEEKRIEAQMGFKAYDFETYWATEADVLGGGYLTSPHIRFKIKNTGSEPITYLMIQGNFINQDKKENFGVGEQCVISSSDPPLQPGYSKQVFFYCSTGYTSDMVLLSPPNMTVELYYEKGYGEGKTLFKTLTISKKARFY